MAYASVIGSSTVIRGNVRGDSSLEILGRVEGDVGVSGDVSLGRDAVVVGSVSGARVLIGGSVEGDVKGSEAVIISETGRVIGDLSAPRIGMSEGAAVQGSVRTEGNGSHGARAPRTAAEPRPAAASAERPAPRGQNAALSSAPIHAMPKAVASAAGGGNASSVAASAPRKQPPPPVILAPRPGARARKKLGKR